MEDSKPLNVMKNWVVDLYTKFYDWSKTTKEVLDCDSTFVATEERVYGLVYLPAHVYEEADVVINKIDSKKLDGEDCTPISSFFAVDFVECKIGFI